MARLLARTNPACTRIDVPVLPPTVVALQGLALLLMLRALLRVPLGGAGDAGDGQAASAAASGETGHG